MKYLRTAVLSAAVIRTPSFPSKKPRAMALRSAVRARNWCSLNGGRSSVDMTCRHFAVVQVGVGLVAKRKLKIFW